MIYNDDTPMPFGKHRGLRMQDVPAEYLLWLLDENSPRGNEGRDRKALLDYIEENRDVLELEQRERGR